MRINILSYEPLGGWILADYAEKLAQHLEPYVTEVSISSSQKPNYDVTFHVNYWGLRQIQVPGLHSTMVTHIDTSEKFALVKAQADAGVWGFCMSEDTTRRLNTFIGTKRFISFPPPAMTSPELHKITVMVAGRLYEDGRKNENWVVDFFASFSPDQLRVQIMGSGWDTHVARMVSQGYSVDYYPQFERETYLSILKASDYLLVTGFDEGALSALDAILFGVIPIVTAQGYHLEQDAEMLLFSTYDELMRIAIKLQNKIKEINQQRLALSDWQSFAQRHRDKWQAISTNQLG